MLVVMRHSERLDFADEDAWFQHPDSRSFPTDSPLTERGQIRFLGCLTLVFWGLPGKSLAKVQGRMLAEMCENTGTPIDVIITSPFVRCVQTAIAVREVLPNRRGDKVPLLIDVEVSEVGIYKKPSGISDPALLRSHLEFCSRRRTFAQVAAIPDLTGVELLNADAFVGIPPPFPEKRRAAHVRGLYRFSEWMERGRQAQLNFLIEWVKYCGWGAALIHRSLKVSTAEKMAKTPPAIHTLKVSSELGSGVRWSPYSVDPRTGRQMRWYPAAEESGVAAVATALQMGLQRTGNLDIVYDMQPGHQDPDYAAFYDQVKLARHGHEKLGDSEALCHDWGKYKEVQIHGEIDLTKNVERIVINERHKARKSQYEEKANFWKEMAAQKGWQIVWVEEMAQELKAKALGKELTRKEFDSILEKIEQAELPDEPSRQKDLGWG
eukprot:g3429.t1